MLYSGSHRSLIRQSQLPPSSQVKNTRIGLLGGSFDPAHKGHVHISHVAKRILNLNAVWWLVTPQNPHKPNAQSAHQKRLNKARDITKGLRWIRITPFEDHINSFRTYQTLKTLKKLYQHTDFIWIGGLDTAHGFHRWENFKDILRIMPVAFIARRPWLNFAKNTVFSKFSQRKIKSLYLTRRTNQPFDKNTVYWVKQGRTNPLSSTLLR